MINLIPEKINGLKQNQFIILLGILLLDVPLSLLASFATNFPKETNDVACVTVVGAHCPSFNVENTLIDLLFWYTLFFVFSIAIFRKNLLRDKLIKTAVFIGATVLILATAVSLVLTQPQPLNLFPSPQPPSTIPTPKTTTTSAKKDETAKETTKTAPCASTLTDSEKLMIETWKTYENSIYKYAFKYPENWVITENKTNSVILTDKVDKTSFQFTSNDSAASTDGLKKTNEKEVQVACEPAKVTYYETISPVTGNDHFIHTVFKKNNIFYMVDLSYKYIGASLSSDIVEAYDLILKTVEFK